MFEKLGIFRMAQGLAEHAATRQSVIARNVANADTPGYRARDLTSFSESYRTEKMGALAATRPGHVLPGEQVQESPAAKLAVRSGAMSPNGNSVSLETEMMMAAEVQQAHQLALSVYQSSLNILRTSLGRR
ncbi:MAG TPA: FlgB family protein [Aliiroseovarius sp.]|nr:FlgB family protein [Aliiroseovarius sp.]